jgi:hypothetical protein
LVQRSALRKLKERQVMRDYVEPRGVRYITGTRDQERRWVEVKTKATDLRKLRRCESETPGDTRPPGKLED